MFKSLKWEDWVGVALGFWLAISPWVLGYAEASPAATMNALFLGSTLIFLEQLNLDVHADLEEWLDVGAGLWLVISPLALDFTPVGTAAINAVGVGLLAIVFALWALSPLDRKLASWWHALVAHR
jgi:hypothetical protein